MMLYVEDSDLVEGMHESEKFEGLVRSIVRGCLNGETSEDFPVLMTSTLQKLIEEIVTGKINGLVASGVLAHGPNKSVPFPGPTPVTC